MIFELPEVETIVRNVDRNLKNQVVQEVDVRIQGRKALALVKWALALKGKKLMQARRRGAHIILDFSDGQSLLANLETDKQLACVPSNSVLSEQTQVVLKFQNIQRELRFNDVSKFSFLKLLDSRSIESVAPIKNLGHEPLQISVKDFQDTLAKWPQRQVKNLLMDQSVIVGIGAMYADEVLFRAKIHPSEKVKDIPFPRMDKLHHAIYHVLELAITHGQTPLTDGADERVKPERFQSTLQVYGREGQVCVRCKKASIQKIKISQKISYVCPYCQPLREK